MSWLKSFLGLIFANKKQTSFIQRALGIFEIKYTDDDLGEYLTTFYQRTWAFLDSEKLLKRMNVNILCAGAGVSSQALELLAKCGFRKFVFADGDVIELQNLSRQNYTNAQLGRNKSEMLKKRLESVNSAGDYQELPFYLDRRSLRKLLPKCDYFINSIDFDSQVYVESHEICRKCGAKEIFPFVLGRRAIAIVVGGNSPSFVDFFRSNDPQEVKLQIIRFCLKKMEMGVEPGQMKDLNISFEKYLENARFYESDPQFATGVYNLAALMEEIISGDLDGKKVKTFPEIYYR